MTTACVVPGSFDPITEGHLDIVRRCAPLFDRVVVAVLVNPSKQGLFTVDERLDLIRTEIDDLPHAEVDRFEGLLVDYCRAQDIDVIVKGLRAAGDYEYELPMAEMNQRMTGVETMFLASSPQHRAVSSSLVKEIARWGGRLTGTVTPAVEAAVRARVTDA